MRDREQEKKIIANATAGPWRIESKDIGDADFIWIGSEIYAGDYLVANTDKEDYIGPHDTINNDAEFIAAARTGWPEDLAWRERAEKLFKKLAWAGGDDEYCQYKFCPCCRRWNQSGHADDCELAALIGEGKQ